MEFRNDVLKRCKSVNGNYKFSASILVAIIKEETGLDNTQELVDHLVSVAGISKYDLNEHDTNTMIDVITEMVKSHAEFGMEEATEKEIKDFSMNMSVWSYMRFTEMTKLHVSMTNVIMALFGNVTDAHKIPDSKFLVDASTKYYKRVLNINE